MAVWATLIGARKDLRLRTKWWHHLAVGVAALSSFIVYLIAVAVVANTAIPLTRDNTYSLTLLNHAAGRQATTTLADLGALSGLVGSAREDGQLVPLPRKGTDTIRCDSTAKYTAGESVSIAGVGYRSIPDRLNQPAGELRHCIATPFYATYTASSVAVYIPNGTDRRKLERRGNLAGTAAIVIWLIAFWNVYYRGLMPFYAKRRERRRRRRMEQYVVR